jgi:AraC-like DNA-binding protein
MNWILLLAILAGIAVVQGLYLAFHSLIRDRSRFGPLFFLGIMFAGISLRIGKSLFYYYWPDMSIHGVVLGAVGLWAIGPSFYLFSSEFSHKNRKWIWIHYLPVFLLILGSFHWHMGHMRLIYFGGAFHILVYSILSLLQFREINGRKIWFLATFLLALGGLFIYQLLSDTMMSYAIGAFIAAGILYGLNFMGMERFGLKVKPSHAKDKDPALDEINEKILTLMEQGIYRESNLTLEKLAHRIDRPAYLVRKAIHGIHNAHFNDFLNKYRINEVARTLEKEQPLYTIEALGKNVGFNSNSSFYSAFRKEKGCTPREYLKKHAVLSENPDLISQ